MADTPFQGRIELRMRLLRMNRVTKAVHYRLLLYRQYIIVETPLTE